MTKWTHFIYIGLFIFSGLLTIASFVLANVLAASPSEKIGGNGNFGLIGFYFLFPFIIMFLAMSISTIHKFMLEKLARKTINLVTFGSLFITTLIALITFIRASQLRPILFEVSPNYRGVDSIPLLSPYSNAIFFNIFTFISLLLLCTFISGLLTKKRKASQ